jgi:large subunit ribosomal protein L31
MKEKIHPQYTEVTVTCICGHSFKTRSTMGKNFNVEICSECHPFFTGKQKLVDSAGRVDRFLKKYGDRRAPEAPAKGKGKRAAEPPAPAAEAASAAPAADSSSK